MHYESRNKKKKGWVIMIQGFGCPKKESYVQSLLGILEITLESTSSWLTCVFGSGADVDGKRTTGEGVNEAAGAALSYELGILQGLLFEMLGFHIMFPRTSNEGFGI